MSVQVADETLTVVIVDPVLVAAGKAALAAVNENAGTGAAGPSGRRRRDRRGARGRVGDGNRDPR